MVGESHGTLLLLLIIFLFTLIFFTSIFDSLSLFCQVTRSAVAVCSSFARVRPLPHARASVSCCRCVPSHVHLSAAAGVCPYTCICQLLQVCAITRASVSCCRCVPSHVHLSAATGVRPHTCIRQLLQVRALTGASVSCCMCVHSHETCQQLQVRDSSSYCA